MTERAGRVSSRGVWLCALFLLAFAARAVVFELGQDLPNRDETAYIELAANWAERGEFAREGRPETHIAPLFPALHALVIRLGAPAQTGGRYLAILLSALVAPAALWASRPVLGHWAAIASGLLVALHPRLLKTAEWVQPEHLTAALWLLFGGLLWRRHRVAAAVVLAFAYLTRPESALLLPLWWLYELVVDRRSWRSMAPATAIALALMLPYLVFLRATVGEWVLTGKSDWVHQQGRVQAASGRQAVSRERFDQLVNERRSAPEQARSGSAQLARDWGLRLFYAFDHLKNALGWPLFVLGWLGVAFHFRHRRDAARLYLPLTLLGLIPVVVVHARHVLPYVPTLLIAAVAAIQSATRLARGRGEARIVP